jgi:hypothetical protein
VIHAAAKVGGIAAYFVFVSQLVVCFCQSAASLNCGTARLLWACSRVNRCPEFPYSLHACNIAADSNEHEQSQLDSSMLGFTLATVSIGGCAPCAANCDEVDERVAPARRADGCYALNPDPLRCMGPLQNSGPPSLPVDVAAHGLGNPALETFCGTRAPRTGA